jgi:hypothetical protein
VTATHSVTDEKEDNKGQRKMSAVGNTGGWCWWCTASQMSGAKQTQKLKK